MVRKVVHKGKIYESVAALSKEVGSPQNTVLHRLRTGLPADYKHEIEVFGVKYDTAYEACESLGIPYSTFIYVKSKKNYTDEESFSHCLSKEPLVFQGRTYKSLTELAGAFGMSIRLVLQRMFRGWTLADSILTPVTNAPGKNVTVCGVSYSSITEACVAMRITPTIISSIVYRERAKAPVGVLIEAVYEYVKPHLDTAPEGLIRIPTLIYKGIWYFNREDLLKEVKVHLIDFGRIKRTTQMSAHETLSYMREMQLTEGSKLNKKAKKDGYWTDFDPAYPVYEMRLNFYAFVGEYCKSKGYSFR